MDIITTARRFEITPAVREHAGKRLQKLDRYFDNIQEIHLVLDQEKHRQIAEVTILVNGTELMSREETHDMLASIDRVVDRIERQVKKYSARLKDRKTHRPVKSPVPVAESEVVDAETSEEEWNPVVVRGGEWHPEPVSVEDAIRLMRETDRDFLMFKNSRSGKICVVHVRDDGNFGLVESD